MTKVKICCISSMEEAELAIKYGASALGFVSAMPSGPGVIEEELICEIIAKLPSQLDSFLLTSRQAVDSIVDQVKKSGANTVQLCDKLIDGTHQKLKSEIPEVKIVQVIHVSGPESVEEASALQNSVDVVLLDSGNPKGSVKELGGTGRTHNWAYSNEIARSLNIPVYLAGGLNPENVAKAIESVGPYGVDVCSGVRSNDRLDEEKLSRFFTQVKFADSTQKKNEQPHP